MNLLDAITTLLDATADMEDRPNIKQARKRLQQRADRLTAKKRIRELKPICGDLCPVFADGKRQEDRVCMRPFQHHGEHSDGLYLWSFNKEPRHCESV